MLNFNKWPSSSDEADNIFLAQCKIFSFPKFVAHDYAEYLYVNLLKSKLCRSRVSSETVFFG